MDTINRNKTQTFKLNIQEKDTLKQKAKEKNMKPSEYIRYELFYKKK